MSDMVPKHAAAKDATAKPTETQKPRSKIGRGGRLVARIVFSPLRLLASIRRSMTAASVTLLLIGIITINIIWGYPWSGLFSACMSMLFVGWTINRIMRPNLEFAFSLPNSSTAGQPFSVVTHVKNRGRLPAMDLSVAFRDTFTGHRAKSRWRNSHRASRSVPCRTLTPPQSRSLIRPAERTDLHASLSFERRGVHALPDLVVTSMFPFHLFRSTRLYPSETYIAVTPRLLSGDDDTLARALLNSLGGWSRKLLSGDALDYTGSREYEVGMPVRRWDFPSWARLGRPIVREFQSPSIQMVTLIVDTSVDADSLKQDREDQPLLERVLSLAATAVIDLTRKTVRVRMYVTSESPTSFDPVESPQSIPDSESLLIRLAAAESVSIDKADSRVQQIIDQVGRLPVLVLTTRTGFQDQHNLPPSVTTIRVDQPNPSWPQAPSSATKKRWRRQTHRPAAVPAVEVGQGS